MNAEAGTVGPENHIAEATMLARLLQAFGQPSSELRQRTSGPTAGTPPPRNQRVSRTSQTSSSPLHSISGTLHGSGQPSGAWEGSGHRRNV